MPTPTIFTPNILPPITDHFISHIISAHSLDSAYSLTDAARDMANFASVFLYQLRQMHRRLNSLGAALHQKRHDAERRAYDMVSGRYIEADGDDNFPIVLKAVELVELRCCGYLEPK